MKRVARSGEELPVDRVVIRLFGVPEVKVGARCLGRLRSRKASSILYLLATHHTRPLARRWIADLLWPDSTDDLGLENLRRTLHDLRKALGEAANVVESVSRSALGLRLEGTDIDVVEFDRATRSNTPEAWVKAVGLSSTGRLLEGEREEWVLEERQRREEACLEMLRGLALDARSRRAPAEALTYLRRAARMNPDCEELCKELLEVLGECENYAEAISFFQQFRRRFRNELGGDVGPELWRLYCELRARARRRLTPKPDAEEGSRT
jgi:DNA-binding SARP family transcriptional activator